MEKLDYIDIPAMLEEATLINNQLILGTLTEFMYGMKIQDFLENGDDYHIAVYSLAYANYFQREQKLKEQRGG